MNERTFLDVSLRAISRSSRQQAAGGLQEPFIPRVWPWHFISYPSYEAWGGWFIWTDLQASGNSNWAKHLYEQKEMGQTISRLLFFNVMAACMKLAMCITSAWDTNQIPQVRLGEYGLRFANQPALRAKGLLILFEFTGHRLLAFTPVWLCGFAPMRLRKMIFCRQFPLLKRRRPETSRRAELMKHSPERLREQHAQVTSNSKYNHTGAQVRYPGTAEQCDTVVTFWVMLRNHHNGRGFCVKDTLAHLTSVRMWQKTCL